ncbi:MAG: hypothetical protein P4L87_24305 [Formivibrio sp.]|nr:hypothetical protein [Formivibrio sp.]
MNEEKPPNDETGTWIFYFALFCTAVDGLAYLIYVRGCGAAFVAIPMLLTWQAVVVVCFFWGFIPAYKSLERLDSEHTAAYMKLIRVALILPAMIATVIWAVLPALPLDHR